MLIISLLLSQRGALNSSCVVLHFLKYYCSLSDTEITQSQAFTWIQITKYCLLKYWSIHCPSQILKCRGTMSPEQILQSNIHSTCWYWNMYYFLKTDTEICAVFLWIVNEISSTFQRTDTEILHFVFRLLCPLLPMLKRNCTSWYLGSTGSIGVRFAVMDRRRLIGSRNMWINTPTSATSTARNASNDSRHSINSNITNRSVQTVDRMYVWYPVIYVLKRLSQLREDKSDLDNTLLQSLVTSMHQMWYINPVHGLWMLWKVYFGRFWGNVS